MPPTSFLELLDMPSVQQAILQSRQEQQRRSLSVAPRPQVAPAAASAALRSREGGRAKLVDRQLNAATADARREKVAGTQAIGLGVADLGLGVLSGIAAQREHGVEVQRQGRLQSLAEQGLVERRHQSNRVLELLRKQEGVARGAFQPVTPVPYP